MFSPFDNAMFTLMPIFVSLMFVIVIGGILFTVFKGIGQWRYNNAQPILSVVAKVVSKRADVTSNMHHDNDGFDHHSTSTTYYITFEVESGDRLEFMIPDREYGMLVEADMGKLTFQGSRYLGFVRNNRNGLS